MDAGENSYKCKDCGKVFNKNCLLIRHEWIHSGVKPYECTECGKTFSKSTHLLQHPMIHTGGRPCKCLEICLQPQISPYKAPADHSGEKPYKCSECGSGKAFTHCSTFFFF
ncbi:Hypothetical predicted protein [Marmota monax]|uniref:C2H2-type domain-containing protein n=1 Tax=Marmota monax TaxID=9995 RepID=A0A5E4D3A0_MARMO|nr:hypothetical protein GHT09_017205 [Marmota monax]VTJ88535.1 Hypothetical predicted protein [Marmota monax]